MFQVLQETASEDLMGGGDPNASDLMLYVRRLEQRVTNLEAVCRYLTESKPK